MYYVVRTYDKCAFIPANIIISSIIQIYILDINNIIIYYINYIKYIIYTGKGLLKTA